LWQNLTVSDRDVRYAIAAGPKTTPIAPDKALPPVGQGDDRDVPREDQVKGDDRC
jgi:hypothetical protein